MNNMKILYFDRIEVSELELLELAKVKLWNYSKKLIWLRKVEQFWSYKFTRNPNFKQKKQKENYKLKNSI